MEGRACTSRGPWARARRWLATRAAPGRRRWLIRVLLLALLLLGADYLAYPVISRAGGRSGNKGTNAIWLRYTWYFGEWNDDELRRCAERLREGQMRYAYCHMRHTGPDGRLAFRYPEKAQRLADELRRHLPSLKVVAWVYVANDRAGGAVDIADAAVRRQMIEEAVWLVTECGFDGIQWDYEICASGDQAFLDLLRETRPALPEGKILSACTPMWYPRPWPRSHCWETDYFSRAAAMCDQLVVMCYDSAIYLPRAYVWLVREQAARVTRAVAQGDPDCRVLLGVPTYGKSRASHHTRAENVRMALKGVREGLGSTRAVPASFAGVSIFADYTTDPEEWEDYVALWVQPGTADGPE